MGGLKAHVISAVAHLAAGHRRKIFQLGEAARRWTPVPRGAAQAPTLDRTTTDVHPDHTTRRRTLTINSSGDVAEGALAYLSISGLRRRAAIAPSGQW